MPSKNSPEQPEPVDRAAAEAPTQQVPADGPAAAAPAPAPTTPGEPHPVATPAPAAVEPGAGPRNRFAWVSSPRVAAATVITVLALGGLGGAFALGRATAGHDHGPRGVMVQMGVPGGPGFDGRGFGHDRFGHDRFGTMPFPGQQLPQQEDGQQEAPASPAPSGSTDG